MYNYYCNKCGYQISGTKEVVRNARHLHKSGPCRIDIVNTKRGKVYFVRAQISGGVQDGY